MNAQTRAQAGFNTRNGTDASLPQESTEPTPCEDCHVREADGMNTDGRALCRPCARRFQCLVPDGGVLKDDAYWNANLRAYVRDHTKIDESCVKTATAMDNDIPVVINTGHLIRDERAGLINDLERAGFDVRTASRDSYVQVGYSDELTEPYAEPATDGGTTDEEQFTTVPRTYQQREHRRLWPAYVQLDDGKYVIDHVEPLENVVRCVNFDDDGDVEEVVSFPWHRVEAIQHHPAEEAVESSPYTQENPLSRGETDE